MQLELRNISKSYNNKKVLEDIGMTMNNGVYGLLGKNGVGKTTLMQIICDLLCPDNGMIFFNDSSIKKLGSKYFEHIGYLPQRFGVDTELTIYQYLKYIARLKNVKEKEIDNCIKGVLEIVNLADMINTKIKSLSGGMRQRVGIAQALINYPDILILDEPTVGLDANERVRFREFVSEYAQNRIVLYSSHIVSDIEYTADHIFIVHNGKIICSGKQEQLLSNIQDKVWECMVSNAEAEVLKRTTCVCNLKRKDNLILLRIVANESPTRNAVPVEHSLEDVYLYEIYRGGHHDRIN